MATKKTTIEKYYRTADKDLKDKAIFEAEKVKEYTTIQTPDGEATISPNNYVLTAPDGSVFGVAEDDLKTLYTKAK